MSTILDLCGGTGAWSKPYRDAGYSTLIVDPHAPILPHGQTYSGTVQEFEEELRGEGTMPFFHGVLAAPPCTEFASSGARWWKDKPPERLVEAVEVWATCMRIITAAKPAWWALENPVGRLRTWAGPPAWSFQPWEYGDNQYKRTLIWGTAVRPVPTVTQAPPRTNDNQQVWRAAPSSKRAALRSLTPPGFARAFFKANP